ncbi:MAG: hypothetical protein ACP5MW_06135 [Thermoplasmata archaeon]
MILNIPIISEINQIIYPYFALVFLFLLAVAIIFFSLYISAKKKINMLKNTDLTIKYHIIKQGEPSKPDNTKNIVKKIEPTKTKEEVLDKAPVKPLPSYALTPDPLKNISTLIDSQNENPHDSIKTDLSKDTDSLPSSVASNKVLPGKMENGIKNKELPVNRDSAKEEFSDDDIKTTKMDLVDKRIEGLVNNGKSHDNSGNIKKEDVKNEPMSIPPNSGKNVDNSEVKNNIKEDNKGYDTSVNNKINNESNSSLINNDFNKNKEHVEENSMFKNALVSEGDTQKVDTTKNNNNDRLAQIDALKKELENALENHISNVTPKFNTDQSTIKKVLPTIDNEKDINTSKQDNNENIKPVTKTNINNNSPNITDAIIKPDGSAKPTNLTDNTNKKEPVENIHNKDSLIANHSTTDSNSSVANTKNVSEINSIDASNQSNHINSSTNVNINKKSDEKHQKKRKKGKSSGV